MPYFEVQNFLSGKLRLTLLNQHLLLPLVLLVKTIQVNLMFDLGQCCLIELD